LERLGGLRGIEVTMSSREAFYVHVGVSLSFILMGMSESYSCLAWAQLLIFMALPLALATIALPVVILVLSVRERQSFEAILFAVALSVILTGVSFCAIWPLCM
jgi:hypothetical protein